MKPIIRWNIGVVSNLGRDCLLRSWRNMVALYGDFVDYKVCYNTMVVLPSELIEMERAGVELIDVTKVLGMWVRGYETRAALRTQKSGWMFSPVQVDPTRRELILDNDIIVFKRDPRIDQFLFGDASRWLFMDFEYKEFEKSEKQKNQWCFGELEPLVASDLRRIDGGIMGVPEGDKLPLVKDIVVKAGLTPELLSQFGWGWEQVVMSLLYTRVKDESILLPHTVIPRALRWTDFKFFDDSAAVHLSGVNQLVWTKRWTYKTYPGFVKGLEVADEADHPMERRPSELRGLGLLASVSS